SLRSSPLAVLVLRPPSLMRRGLRPAFRGVFPCPRPAEHSLMEDCAAEHLPARAVGVVVAIARVAVTEERTQAKRLAGFLDRPKFTLKSPTAEENHGMVQPMRCL